MKNKRLIIALSAILLCFISMVGTSLLNTDFGKVKVENVVVETPIGELTGYLFVPKGVDASNKAPAIVVSHGASASAEFVDSWYVELTRRGFIVFAPHLYGHGDTPMPEGENYAETISYLSNGLYDAVEYLATLDFVDTTKIGITGHSLGGGSSLTTTEYYTKLEQEALASGVKAEEAHKLNKVASCLTIGYPLTVNIPAAGVVTNFDGYLADVGVVLGSYDDFQAWMNKGFLTNEHGSNWYEAQVGQPAPTEGLTEGAFYFNPDNGYLFAAWNPNEIHNQNIVSTPTAKALVEFFDETLGAPKFIDSSNQVWIAKKAFGLLGMIGFFIFLVPCMDYVLDLPMFKNLRNQTKYVNKEMNKKEKRRFVTTTIIGSLINTILLIPMILIGSLALVNSIWPQSGTSGFALWGLFGGLVTLLMMRISAGKFKGRGDELGTKIPLVDIFKSLLAGFIVIGITYLLVYFAKFVFNTDFRMWSYAIRPFGFGRFLQGLRYLPFFVVFQIANAMATIQYPNSHWSDWKRILFATAICMIPIIIMLIITYAPILVIGMPLWGQSGTNILLMAMGNGAIKLLSFVISLVVISAINIKAQKLTGNIWLGAFVNTLLIVFVSVANCNSLVNF